MLKTIYVDSLRAGPLRKRVNPSYFPKVPKSGVASLVCTSSLNATATVSHKANAALVCTSSLNATATVSHKANATLICVSSLGGKATVSHKANATLICTSSLGATGVSGKTGIAHLLCTSSLNGTATVAHKANATLLCTSSLNGTATVAHKANATLVCVSSLNAKANIAHKDSALLNCSSLLLAAGGLIREAEALIGCTSLLTALGTSGMAAKTIEQALVLILKQSQITAYPAYRPQTSNVPGILYTMGEDTYGNSLLGSAGFADCTFSIEVYHQVESSVDSVSETIRQVLNAFSWTQVGAIFIQAILLRSRSTHFTYLGINADVGTYVSKNDYFVKYTVNPSTFLPLTGTPSAATVEQALCALLTNAGFTGYPQYRPQLAGVPRVVYSLDSDAYANSLLGSAGFGDASFTIEIYDQVENNVDTTAEAIRLALNGVSWLTVGNVFIQTILWKTRETSFEYLGVNADIGTYISSNEVFVKYTVLPVLQAQSLLFGSSGVVASPINIMTLEAPAYLMAGSSLGVRGTEKYHASCHMHAICSQLADGVMVYSSGLVGLTGHSSLSALGYNGAEAHALIAGSDLVLANGTVKYAGAAGLAGGAGVVGNGLNTKHGHSVMLCGSVMVGIGVSTKAGHSMLQGGSVLNAIGTDTPGVTTFYMRSDVSPTVTLPTTLIDVNWVFSGPDTGGSCLTLSLLAKGGPFDATSFTYPTLSAGGSTRYCLGQFASKALTAQSVAAGTYTVAFSTQVTVGVAAYEMVPCMSLFLMKSNGTYRTTIFSMGPGTPQGFNVEYTSFKPVSGATWTSLANDYLLLELGSYFYTSVTQSPEIALFWGGTTPITADSVPTSSALSYIQLPVAVTFQ